MLNELSQVTEELANRVILPDGALPNPEIPAENTLLIKSANTNGKEYEPLTLGTTMMVTGGAGSKVLDAVGGGGGMVPHALGGVYHTADTIAHIQTKVSDGSLITSAAGEVNTLTAKTNPVGADVLLIEDSAATFAKKKTTLAQALSAGETDPIFIARAVMTSHYTGFPNRTDSSLSFNEGTRLFTISGTFDIYSNGGKYSPSGAGQCTITVSNVSGLYFIWYTIVGGIPTLNVSTSFPGFNNILVATVYWNALNGKGALSEERHWAGRDRYVHEYLHETIGARYASGLNGTFTNTTFSVSSGEYYDEDIEYATGSAITKNDLYYLNSETYWSWDIDSTTVYKAIAGTLQYDNANVLTPVPNNNYVAAWVYASNRIGSPIISIIGQRVDNNITNARANNNPSTLNFASLPTVEMKLLYRVLYQQTSGGIVYVETADYRTQSSLPGAGYVAPDHATLAHLDYTTANHTGFVDDGNVDTKTQFKMKHVSFLLG